MSKYQEVMDHIKVDDEMKKRILQNVEKKLEEAPQEVVTPKPKVVPFKRYAAIAATFTVLLVGSYAVMQATGGIGGTNSSTSVCEPVMEEAASMAEEPSYEAADSAAEAPAMEAETDGAAYEAPAMEAETGNAAIEAPAAEPSMDKAENAVSMQPVMNEAQPNASVSANMEPIVPIVLTAVIAIFILVVVIIFVRKRKR